MSASQHLLTVGMAPARPGSEIGGRIRCEGRGCAATEAVIIGNLWEMHDADILETQDRQRADDALAGVPDRGGDRARCDRERYRPAGIRAVTAIEVARTGTMSTIG